MLGLILSVALFFSFQIAEAKIIWETSGAQNGFSFAGYSKVMVNPAFLPEKIEASLVAALKEKGKLVLITSIDNQAYNAFGNAQVSFSLVKVQTSDPETILLEFIATTTQRDQINSSFYSSNVWEKLVILHSQDESLDEMQKIISETVESFLSKFNAKDVVFYFPDPSKKYGKKSPEILAQLKSTCIRTPIFWE